MKYQETGRFGRITKNMRRKGFETEMETVLFDSTEFVRLKKNGQTEYIEKVMCRMIDAIGQDNANDILFECGARCCGKSWSNFAKRIWADSDSADDFFIKLNVEEEKYHTHVSYDSLKKYIKVNRSKCICGLINKGKPFNKNKSFCNCSIGHMSVFFNSIFSVQHITLERSIFNGDHNCEWTIELD